MSITYLSRDNRSPASYCKCNPAYITYPPQMDCPWCGCGWLFTCIDCRKAFTFAIGVEISLEWHELARRDLRNQWEMEPEDDDVEVWVAAMRGLLVDIQIARRYVWFDGVVIPADASGIKLDGWYARHNFDFIPQVAALTDPRIVKTILADVDYWQRNAVPNNSHDDELED